MSKESFYEFDGIKITVSGFEPFRDVKPSGITSGTKTKITITNGSGKTIRWCNIVLAVRRDFICDEGIINSSVEGIVDEVIEFNEPLFNGRSHNKTPSWPEELVSHSWLNTFKGLPKSVLVHKIYGKYSNNEPFEKVLVPVKLGVTCFPSGTSILTPYGERAIEEIKKGDVVLSWNQNKRAFFKRIVKRVDSHAPQPVSELTFTDGVDPLLVTLNHSVATSNGWKRVGDLKQGDALWVVNKQTGLLGLNTVLNVGDSGKILPVHNLIVEGEHNFIAGGVIAHSFAFARTLRSTYHRACEKTKALLVGQPQAKPVYVIRG